MSRTVFDLLGAAPDAHNVVVRSQTHLHQPWRLDRVFHLLIHGVHDLCVRQNRWLEAARDWCVSRSRFWGTPLPIWVSDDGEEHRVVGSIEELENLSGEKVRVLVVHSGSIAALEELS